MATKKTAKPHSAAPVKSRPVANAKSAPKGSQKSVSTPKSDNAAKGNGVVSKPSSKKAASEGKEAHFVEKQREKLLCLKDMILDNMNGVARDSLRSRAEGSEASAFGMHQADAGSDAYDRDFALSLLSQEQDSLYEIEEALKRIENGTYGICEMSGKPIPKARLEALPFTRYTVECQAEIEKRSRYQRYRQPVTSLFGTADEEAGEGEDEDAPIDSKD